MTDRLHRLTGSQIHLEARISQKYIQFFEILDVATKRRKVKRKQSTVALETLFSMRQIPQRNRQFTSDTATQVVTITDLDFNKVAWAHSRRSLPDR